MRARVSDGELEDLFDGTSPVVSFDGRKIFYTNDRGLFARSLEGHIPTNTPQLLTPECILPGIAPTQRGVYYVSCNERRDPVAILYFEFSTGQAFNVGPPPVTRAAVLTVSTDGRRLLYQTELPNNGELTRVTFRGAKP
jgi:hypothetical protein